MLPHPPPSPAAEPLPEPSATPRRLRLDPFAFPSDTTLRLVLLTVSVLGAGLLSAAAAHDALTGRVVALDLCRERAFAQQAADSFVDLFRLSREFSVCTAPLDRARAGWMLGGVALLIAIAAIRFWTFPQWKLRRDRLLTLGTSELPDLSAELAALCAQAGLTDPPELVWHPLSPLVRAQAFGHRRRYYVELTGGLVKQFYVDRPAFQAILRHELAHLRNRDVERTYLSVAVWEAFVLVSLASVTLSLLAPGRSPLEAASDLARLLGVAALVYLSRNAVLRSRELYADVRAFGWDGPEGALRRILAALPTPRYRWWRRLPLVHPDPEVRQRTLDDPAILFRIGFWEALGAGLAAGIALPNLVEILSLLAPVGSEGPPAPSSTDPGFVLSSLGSLWVVALWPLAAAIVFGPVVVWAVGLGVWRAAHAELAGAASPPGVGRLAVGLGLGFLGGQHLSFASGSWAHKPFALDPWSLAGFEAIWGVCLVASLWLVFGWMHAGARTWLPVMAVAPSTRVALPVGLTIAGGLVIPILAGLTVLYLAIATEGGAIGLLATDALRQLEEPAPLTAQTRQTTDMLAIGFWGVVMAGAFSAWAFPLAAWLWRPRISPTVDSSEDRPVADQLAPARPADGLRPGLAALIAIAGGILGSGWFLALGPQLAPLPDTEWVRPGVLIAIQVMAAVVAAAVIRPIAALHGLAAAFLAGLIQGLILVVATPTEDSGLVLSGLVASGSLLSLPAILVVAPLARQARRFTRPRP